MLLALSTACRVRTNPVDPQLARFVPADATVLAGARLDQLRVLPDWLHLADPGLQARELLAIWDGAHWLIAARGPRTAPPPSAAFAVIGDVTLAGSPEALRAASRRRGSRPDLLTRAEALPAGSQIWAVSNGPVDLPGLDPGTSRLLKAVADVAVTAALDSGLHAVATGDCLDERNAQYFENTVRGMLSLAHLNQSVQLSHEGRSVKIVASLPPDAVEKFLRRLTPAR